MILLIDNYDSFVFNIKQYIEETVNEEVLVIRNDKITIDEIIKLNPTKIILSPGPKHPKESKICLDIINKIKHIPILGICLGHQAIGQEYGAKIKYLEIPKHGKTSKMLLENKSKLLKNIPNKIDVMRYHSLYISEDNFPDELEILAKSDDGIIMMIKHRKKEIYGMQFHPESYFTEYGKQMIKNFMTI